MVPMSELPVSPYSKILAAVRERTPARILVGRAGSSYRTPTLLELRRDRAAAIDAVHAEVEMERDLGGDLVRRFHLFEVHTQAGSKEEYLRRPDLGRRLDDAARETLRKECPAGCVVQTVIGDGLSAAAVAVQAPGLLTQLDEEVRRRGWSFGRPFFIRHCRVGVINDIGGILDPEVVILLIGERPGLATAESLSAYLAYRPRPGHTDAQRNLISNIHARGVGHEEAARRIVALAEQMRSRQTSGVAIKEKFGERDGLEKGGDLTAKELRPRLA
jgi:ethanolamine ammonia-lyase small subunit